MCGGFTSAKNSGCKTAPGRYHARIVPVSRKRAGFSLMSLGPKLLLRQSQSLVMTPQLMQAIKLLQLSSLDLQAYIAQEIEQNPLLERADTDGPAVEGEDVPPPPAEAADARDGDWMDENLAESRAAIEERLDTDLGNVFQDEAPMAMSGGEGYTASAWSGVGGGGDQDGEHPLDT